MDGDVRIGPLLPILAVLSELGHDPAPILASVGLDAADFRDPDRRVAYATAGALLAACAEVTGIPHFGLLVGRRFELESMGIVARLMRDSGSVGAALAQLVRHLYLSDRGAVAYLSETGEGRVALGYSVHRHDTPGIAQIYDLTMAIAFRMLRALCGKRWNPLSVSLMHSAPRDRAPYRRFFGVPVRFDSAYSEVIFDGHWLNQPVAEANVGRRLLAERVALAAEHRLAVAERTLYAVERLVLTGSATSSQVSAALGLHERALRRMLLAEGTSLQPIINAARLERAQLLLVETRLPVHEISSALRFSDATAFSRAFRSWSGVSPRTWRVGNTAAKRV